MEEKRCCDNCGRTACANSIVAFIWDLCVKDGFTKYWIPKKQEEQPDGEAVEHR